MGYHASAFPTSRGDTLAHIAASTVPALFRERVSRTPDAEAFRHAAGDRWVSLSWRETEERVRSLACGLRALGLRGEERCSILAGTSIEWILVDFAILCAGGATTTVYPSSTVEDCVYILSDSQSAYAFVEDEVQLAKLRASKDRLPLLRKVILLRGEARGHPDDGWVLTLEALGKLGASYEADRPGLFERSVREVRPDALATLVYTSGTTGRPKGVELLHEGWVAQAEAVERSGILNHENALQYFWLPLSHVFGKMIGTAQLRIGFPTVVDGRVEKIVENLKVVRPTFMCAVPRVLEKAYSRLLQRARQGGRVRLALFRWALRVGRERASMRRDGKKIGPLLALRFAVADRLVLVRVRAVFGGRLHFFVSGSAPISVEVVEMFEAAGLPVLEGYGLTESSAATHVNLPWALTPGTVGPALPGIEVRIAPDGEVLMRGRWIMRAYHDQPAATVEALEGDWLHTGDVGEVDARGYLTITDRKKDLIKTSGGKYVAPRELEGRLKVLSPLVSQVLVHGDRRTFVTALVTLDPEAFSEWARAHGLGRRPPEELVGQPALRAEIQRAVDELNAGLPRFAVIRRFTLLPHEFSEGAGEMTPSHKLRRKVIEEHFRSELDAMYGDPLRGL
ncbi:MAG TPA: long-chain fatty acid--CoA ligase [Anaeromyxobacteraceae bacterium]|nr:long-chain fatty acid--CoA ligase [Anaeromyxobacteraceae bacterium]